MKNYFLRSEPWFKIMPKITKTIRGVIDDVVAINSGTTDKGRSWTLFEVSINGQTFRTFDGGYNDKIGQEGEWIYEEEDRISASGKKYRSRTLLPLPKKKKTEEKTQEQGLVTKGFGLLRGEHQKLSKEIEKIEFKLGQLENLLQAINVKVSGGSIEADKPQRPELKTFGPDIGEDEVPLVEDEPK